MTTDIIKFEGQHEVMILTKEDVNFDFKGDYLMRAKDGANALEYTQTKAFVNLINPKYVYTVKNSDLPKWENRKSLNNAGETFISSFGLYQALANSTMPKAEPFQDWLYEEMLPSIQKQGHYIMDSEQVPSLELQIKQQRAEIMAINAKTNRHKTVMKSLKDMNLSPIAFQVAGLTALEELIEKKIDYRPEVEKMYTATEIGLEVGAGKGMVGRVANANGLKTDEYGMTVLDKALHCSKEVPSFRYNERGRQRLLELFEKKQEVK